MSKTKCSLQFLGAAGTVTGSRTLIRRNDQRLLIDCGLFQGPREIRELNWMEFQNASKVDAVILTHAHIDHSGFLPKLVKNGFKGPIYCSSGTKDLCEVLLPDAARIQEEDARFANKTKHSKHDPALPLYNEEDAQQALSLFKCLDKDQWSEVLPDMSVRLTRSGHILGSNFVEVSWPAHQGEFKISFSGDIGNDRSNILRPPVHISETDHLVLESTYGDRRQPRGQSKSALSYIINKVIGREGTLVIPSFAVGRTQELIYLIKQLEEENQIPHVPVYVDSPMALNATSIYMAHQDELRSDFSESDDCSPICPSDYRSVTSADESMMLCLDEQPKIVISAAGMLSGGRVLHHLKAKLPNEKNGVLFVGYQATGTKGLLLKNGLREISIHHKLVTVEAEIFVTEGLSAHGDSEDIMEWLAKFEKFPSRIYLNHGEENASRSLQYMIQSHYDCDVIIPKLNEKFELPL